MDMTGERHIPAPRQKVWDALNDPEVLKQCIPGCESLEKLSDTEMKATAAVKIGPISARFTGKVKLEDLNPPTSYRISGEGQGGVAGFAKGGADVTLADDGQFTLLTYAVKAQVGGKIAQLGARLIDASAKQMAELFFDRFTAEVAAPPSVGADGASGLAAKAATAVTGDQAGDDALAAHSAAKAQAPARPAAISVLSLIPKEPYGFPIVFWIGLGLFLIIFFMLFKAYVFG